jgi:hypothetical protein
MSQTIPTSHRFKFPLTVRLMEHAPIINTFQRSIDSDPLLRSGQHLIHMSHIADILATRISVEFVDPANNLYLSREI